MSDGHYQTSTEAVPEAFASVIDAKLPGLMRAPVAVLNCQLRPVSVAMARLMLVVETDVAPAPHPLTPEATAPSTGTRPSECVIDNDWTPTRVVPLFVHELVTVVVFVRFAVATVVDPISPAVPPVMLPVGVTLPEVAYAALKFP